MSEQMKLLIEIKAKVDQAVKGLEAVGDQVDKNEKKTSAWTDTMKVAKGMLINQLSNAAARFVGDAITLGGSVETLQNSFNAMAAEAGRAGLKVEDLQEVMGGTISKVDLLSSANKFMALNLPIDQMENLMQSAVSVGRAMGMDAAKSVDDLSTALGRASPLILDNFGIQLKLTEAYDAYALSLGKTAEELTEAEKKTAFQVVAIEKLQEKAAILTGTVSESQLAQERFAASLENAKTSLGALLAPLGALGPVLQGAMPIIGTMTAQALPGLISSIGGVSGAMTLLTGPIGIALAAVAALAWAWKNNFMDIQGKTAAAVEFVQNILGGLGKTIEKVLGWFDNLFKGSKKSLDKTAKNTQDFADSSQESMYSVQYGESPGGIQDVIQAAADMEKTWNRAARNMQSVDARGLGMAPGLVQQPPGGQGGRSVVIQRGAIQISGQSLEPNTSRIRLTDDIGERLGKLLTLRR